MKKIQPTICLEVLKLEKLNLGLNFENWLIQ